MNQPGILTETKEESLVQQAIKKISSQKKFDILKANVDGYEAPSPLTKSGSDESYVPDITAVKNGEKSYFELAIKNGKIQETISKWKLLSTLAQIKNGKFYLIVPKGNFAFTQRMMEKYSLNAQVIKL